MLFLPDRNLGAYVQRQTGRANMKIWQGSCIVHATFPARRLMDAKVAYPNAKVVAHPGALPLESVLCSCGISWARLRPLSNGVEASDDIRIHRHDGKRHSLLASNGCRRRGNSTSWRTRTATAANALT